MKILIILIALMCCGGTTFAKETLTEKSKVMVNSSQRSAKKALHRTKESACGKLTGASKAECLAEVAKNRLEEGKDAVKDKASEVKNKVDSDEN
jgi:hypothetical protein